MIKNDNTFNVCIFDDRNDENDTEIIFRGLKIQDHYDVFF